MLGKGEGVIGSGLDRLAGGREAGVDGNRAQEAEMEWEWSRVDAGEEFDFC